MRHIGTVILVGITLGLIWLFDAVRFQAVPLAPGRLLDPFHGFWQNMEGERPKWDSSLAISGLKGKVVIQYDARRVPHVFAENDDDLYFAQGYVTARDRLWQMEFQIMAASGRLSEVVADPRVLNLDRLSRRRGMVSAAETALNAAKADAVMWPIFEAYTAGVNAYIEHLGYRELPMEYKLLDYWPEAWTPLKTCLLLKLMAWDLTGRTEDFEKMNAYMAYGGAAYDSLYPLLTDSTYPIIPRGTAWGFSAAALDTPANYSPAGLVPRLQYPQPSPELGSNNWAVAGSKTKNGYPILCNDPHLGLRLPSLWYEIQLVSPTQNVYGVSLPGSPCVIIGFNSDVAWGVTNASRDVLDWYKIDFKDAGRNEYKYADGWRPVKKRVEEIKVRGKAALLDTVLYTHHGPLVYDSRFGDPDSVGPVDIAMRWAGADSSFELRAIYLLNHAKSHADYQAALKYFYCPGQNFIFISKTGDVAITQNGHFPAKWPGQGEFVMDGSDPQHEWQAYIPMDQNPHVLNPAQGFIFSSNQAPTDAGYPYNVDGSYDMTRNRRIHMALAGMKGITVEDMQKLQNDNLNVKAGECLPRMLAGIEGATLGESAQWAVDTLKGWDWMNEAHREAPALFDYWERAFVQWVWADDAAAAGKNLVVPNSYSTLQLALAGRYNRYVDDVRTPEVESLRDALVNSLEKAMQNREDWWQENALPFTWQNVNNVRVMHLLRRPSLSHERIAIGGNKGIVNANSQNFGASWRMIVELGPEPNAWGVYPGGQAGNPGSPHYDNGIPAWAKGEYFRLEYMKAPQASGALFTQQLTPVQP